MSSALVGLISVACIFGGTLVGLALRRVLPEEHLNSDSRDAVKVGAGMISTMAALVLGLLVGSAKQNFDSASEAMVQGGAKVILLDRLFRSYGPEANELRDHLRKGVAASIQIMWPEEGNVNPLDYFENFTGMDRLADKVRALTPSTDVQRSLQRQAETICNELLLSRWVQVAQSQTTLPAAFLVILLFWFTVLYVSFGLIAPRNPTVLSVMFVGALALASALFLILEMNRPIGGMIKVSSAPMRKALEHLNR